MLKNEEICQKYPFFRKELKEDFEAEWMSLRVDAFSKFAKETEKTIVTLWILSTKNLFLTA